MLKLFPVSLATCTTNGICFIMFTEQDFIQELTEHLVLEAANHSWPACTQQQQGTSNQQQFCRSVCTSAIFQKPITLLTS